MKISSEFPAGGVNGLTICVIAGLAIAPLVALAMTAASGASSQGPFSSDIGWIYLSGTLFLAVSAGAGALILGISTALIIALTDFPGRRFFRIALALPFAAPAYILAYVYADIFSPFGPVADIIGVQNTPNIRSFVGAAIILAITTYPYIYLTVTAALSSRSGVFLEAARSLGAGPLSTCRRVLLGVCRPAIAGGLALALMEIVAEYGVADYYGVRTLSVGIFRQWHGLGDLAGATQLALSLFMVAIVLALAEEFSRRGDHAESARAHRSSTRLKLSPAAATGAMLFLSLPVIAGFALPFITLLSKLADANTVSAARGLSAAAINSTGVAIAGAVIAVSLAAIAALQVRQTPTKMVKGLVRAATLGYAIPGAVIAIGVLALAAPFGAGASFTGGVAILVYAYVIRFMTAGYNSASAGLAQVNRQIDHAAQNLGANPIRIFREIHWPLTRNAILAGGAIIALDIAKELPATLLLRPFNFETLSTRVYRLAADERLSDAAPAALLLLGLGVLLSLFLIGLASNEKTRRL